MKVYEWWWASLRKLEKRVLNIWQLVYMSKQYSYILPKFQALVKIALNYSFRSQSLMHPPSIPMYISHISQINGKNIFAFNWYVRLMYILFELLCIYILNFTGHGDTDIASECSTILDKLKSSSGWHLVLCWGSIQWCKLLGGRKLNNFVSLR